MPPMSDLFQQSTAASADYSAAHIEVLEGLEPVRRRPGMYIGGTDERACHHLAAEVLDNAMDEAVAGHASIIEMTLNADNTLTIRDNGRGIPVDPHPKYPDRSALEVILTTLHAGGKFGSSAYKVSGGLHGVGVSVVNALSDRLEVDVARDRVLWRQSFSRGTPLAPVTQVGSAPNRRGTQVTFHPDPEIFGAAGVLRPATLYRMARSKAYLFRGVSIRWRCDPAMVADDERTPSEENLRFPNGLEDFLQVSIEGRETVTPSPFTGQAPLAEDRGRLEWALAWPADDDDGFLNTYVNTIPTPEGGSHEQGLRAALLKGLRTFADHAGVKKAAILTAEDVVGGMTGLLSLFISEPQFQGQTKERLAMPDAARLVEAAVRDPLDHWLAGSPNTAHALLAHCVERAEERMRRRQQKELTRKTATKKARLPGKLADCARADRDGTELFIVEGDSAGGSAKQARSRETQAVLPLRGKILNVASASDDKLAGNQELKDLVEALGCGVGSACDLEKLRYERVIIMTDADVDGAHIASLLMTFFFQRMPRLVRAGHLYLAVPPLYRVAQGAVTAYAIDDAHKDALMAKGLGGKGKVEISRFKGLGEMPASQLKETTMDPAKRTLIRVRVPQLGDPEDNTTRVVDDLMGRKAELRFKFIQEHASFARDLDI